MHLHDIPKCIKPKFDLVAICVEQDLHSIQDSLQEATSQLVQWADNEGMSINAAKTKVMVFGNQVHSLSIKIKNTEIENVRSFKYLGRPILLDPMLDFGMQVDYAVGKAKRAMAKVCTLINGREGIGVQLGINLYKALVRPHLEYAILAWANISDKDLTKLENVQIQCLRRVIGAKAHSSSAAVEVICGIVPMRFRKRDLCCREYIRILIMEEDHELKRLMEVSKRDGLRFCPLKYIKIVSRELDRLLDGQKLEHNTISLSDYISVHYNIFILDLKDDGSYSDLVHDR